MEFAGGAEVVALLVVAVVEDSVALVALCVVAVVSVWVVVVVLCSVFEQQTRDNANAA